MDKKTVFSTCGMCLARCLIEVDVVNGKPVFIRGNMNSPLKGALCPKGAAGIALYNDAERPQRPLMREGERGEGRFREAGWDEALDYVAGRLKSIMSAYGPQSLLWSERGGPYTDLNKAFLRALGTPNFFNHDATCSHNVNEACFSVTGRGRNDFIYDYKNCRLAVFQARNPLESLVVKEVNDIMDGVEAGCKIVALDSRASVTACKADLFFMARPGTDYALNLGVMHAIIKERLYNPKVLDSLYGFAELEAFIEPYTPEWAAGETGLKAENVYELAGLAAEAAPAMIWHPGWMTARYAQSAMVSRSAYIINALMGSIGSVGGLLLAGKPGDAGKKGLRGLAARYEAPKVERADGIGGRFGHFSPEASLLHRAFQALRDDKPYPLRAYIAYRHDPLSSFPDPRELKKLLNKLELLVSLTFSWSDTAFYSDVVLPLPVYLESDSPIGVKPGLKPQFFLRRKAAEPRFDSREGWRIICDLAGRLGIAGLNFKNIEELWARQLEGTGYTPEDFAAKGFIELSSTPLRLDVFPLPNSTGKLELINPRLREAGIECLEPYRATSAVPEGAFRLIIGRSALHTHAHTQNNSRLSAKMPENTAWIHPSRAGDLRIKDYDLIKVIASDGSSCKIRAKVTNGIHPEALFMVHGFGHALPVESRAFARGAADQEFMLGGLDKEDSFGRAVALQEHFVRVERVSE